jgi:hypothetical protein|tara:strand:- start:1758 stop:2609 length:852 start_codon:yes stop_codon:yes gene_type:complete
MSNQITTAFVQQFSANIQLLSQQKVSLLRGAVREESINGEKAFFDQVGSTTAQLRTSRHADTPLIETPHARRMVLTSTYEVADLIDDSDKVRLLTDPSSTYAKAMAGAMGRAMDDAIITAATGAALTGKTGASSVALSNTIATGGTGLTIAKLVAAKKTLDEGSVDPSITRYIAVSPEQIEDLLNSTTVTSADFNTVKALSTGEIDSFVGFKFIVTNRLGLAGSDRACFAWAEDGLLLGVGKNVTSRIEERADKSYSTQVYYCADFGATRMEEAKVVQINCAE